ncbi:hypothetical protein EV193_107137 [Herbihabitans rhizosphaerae]|uniref:Uncharacterized protein n=1 Tax=Herbihabitans rhizosphaerae TaxID=1872711 RepID=A0A4Q7KJT6_9PSEU|nr:hypothetical protein EV193_107137 [Herbihabitans rhizosphaerae]
MTRSRWVGLAARIAVLAALVVLSVAVGARAIPAGEVWRLPWHPDGSELSTTVHDV